jgi:CBS-domain-containing membrane protein
MEIREVMTDNPESCDISAAANEASRIMWERDCGAVPVIDAAGRVAGIVTDRDICMAAYFQGLPLTQIRVADIMTRQPCTCTRDHDLADAEQLMQDRQIRRLPIVDDSGALVGMLSLADVAQAVKRTGAESPKSSEFKELFQTVAAVSEPRRPQA